MVHGSWIIIWANCHNSLDLFGGLLKQGYPQIIPFNRSFHEMNIHKPSSELGVPPHFRRLPFPNDILVGGFNPSEKYSSLGSWDDDIPNIWENKKSPKPPTR